MAAAEALELIRKSCSKQHKQDVKPHHRPGCLLLSAAAAASSAAAAAASAATAAAAWSCWVAFSFWV